MKEDAGVSSHSDGVHKALKVVPEETAKLSKEIRRKEEMRNQQNRAKTTPRDALGSRSKATPRTAPRLVRRLKRRTSTSPSTNDE